jgi:hypothetical protein
MNRKGVSLVELVLAIAAGASIALVAFLLVEPFNNLMFTFWRRSGADEAQAAMTRMLQEVERTKSPGNITTFTGTRFTFTDIQDQAVDFQKSGTDLLRNADVLLRNVQSLDFEYLDENGAITAVKANIRVVRVILTILSGDQIVRFQSAAQLRNGVT